MFGSPASDASGMPQPQSDTASTGTDRPRHICACLAVLTVAAVLLALLAVPAGAATAPTLTPFAGDRTYGTAVPGPALATSVYGSQGIGADPDGNIYITDGGYRVEKISADGTLSYVAGDGSNGVPVPGPALSSPLGYLYALAVDGAGNVIVGDYYHALILRITPAGTLSIIAGNGSSGSPVAGPALASPLNAVFALAADAAGNVYFQNDPDETLWKISVDGSLTQIAGSGAIGVPVAGPALSSPLDQLYGTFAVGPDGTVYGADTAHCTVFAVAPAGTLSIAAGTGSCGTPVPGPATASPLGNVQGVAVDAAGNLYLASPYDRYVFRVSDGALSIFAGSGANGASVAGPPTASPLQYPMFVTTDGAGTVYFTTALQIVRVGSATPSAPRNLTVTAGDGSAVLAFRPPVTPGTSAISGYEASTDGGTTWLALATTPGSGATLTATVSGLVAGTSTSVLVRARNGSGGGDGASGMATLPAPVVVITAPTPTAAPTLVASNRFTIAVRLRLPAGCGKACVITRATLALRNGTILGARSAIALERGGWVRFTISVDKAALVAAGGSITKPGWRTTLTRFDVATRTPAGARWAAVKRGHITVSLARITSGLEPRMAGLL